MVNRAKRKRGASIFVFPLHLGGSNGPKLELDAIFTPPYNAARYGISLTSSPQQADVVLLLGVATAKMAELALELLANLPEDVKLVLLGSEATSAAPFAHAYAVFGPLGEYTETEDNLPAPIRNGQLLLPPGRQIAAYVAGSPPDPQVIIDTILQVSP